MLTSQYRMHPEIREFPNRYFYQSRLHDAKKVLQRPVPMFVRKMTAALEDGEVRDDSSQWLGRYRFFDVAHGKARTEKGGTSLGNQAEADAVMLLLQHLRVLGL